MKKFIPQLLFVFFISACSTDKVVTIDEIIEESKEDETITDSDDEVMNEESDTRELLKIIQKSYDNAELSQQFHFIFEDGKIEVDSAYSPNGQLIYYNDWIYDEGILAGTKLFLADGTLQHENAYTFDSQNNLINRTSSEEQGAYSTTVSYTYHNDSIVSNKNFDGYLSNKTFYLNESGFIYKEVDGENISEVEYSEDNSSVKSLLNNSDKVIFTYSDDSSLEEPFNKHLRNILGTKNNIVLWGNSLRNQVNSLSVGFLTKEENDTGVLYTHEFTFDDEGYPLTKKTFWIGALQSEFEYIYE